MGNHKSATDSHFPLHDAIVAFDYTRHLTGEDIYFMIRLKPNSDRCRVIVVLRWPLGSFVNMFIDKDSYLDSDFALTFPTVDDIAAELKMLGCGTLLYMVDISRAFHHIKFDLVLLGLEWNGHYVDTCVPFVTHHRIQIFQCLGNGIRYIMRLMRYIMRSLIDLMGRLRLTINQNELFPPTMQVMCLGILIDTVHRTIAIPPEKLCDVMETVLVKQGSYVKSSTAIHHMWVFHHTTKLPD